MNEAEKVFSRFSAAAQMRRRHISRRGAVKQGYYTEWETLRERILAFSRIAPHGLPAVCESFFNRDSV